MKSTTDLAYLGRVLLNSDGLGRLRRHLQYDTVKQWICLRAGIIVFYGYQLILEFQTDRRDITPVTDDYTSCVW